MSYQILVVDDERPICEVLRDILIEEGYRVTTACDGRAALVALAGEGYDLVLSDVMLPDVTGRDLARAMHTDPGLSAIPLVLMSADGETQACGVPHAAFIRKPFDVTELLDTVERILDTTAPGWSVRRIGDSLAAPAVSSIGWVDWEHPSGRSGG